LDNKEIIEKFKSIGFKEYEAKIFIVLMKGIPLSASEIASEAKLIRNSIYDTLKAFAQKGFCNEIETTSTLKYQIINPEIIIGKVEKEYNDINKNRVSTLKDAFGELQNFYKKNSPESDDTIDNVELIRGFNKHRVAKYMELINNAKFEILSMNRLKGLITDEINDFTKKFTKKGGVIKSLYKISLDFKVMKGGKAVAASNDDLINVCEMFERFGEEVKLTVAEIPNMVIIDREKVFLNITGDSSIAKNKQTDLIINDKPYTENMRDLFINYWEKSATIKEYHGALKVHH
jgi:sugar-specific transcriptional regulator TrmB